MRRRSIPAAVVSMILGLGLLVSACSPSAPPPAPTQSPAVQPNAAEPTKAPATQPTAVPAPEKKAIFPEKGKPITMNVPWAAGGGTDVGARLLAPLLEKELGVPVEVVNKPGAGTQVGITALVTSKPDGYTIGFTNVPTTITLYLDPDRKAVFGRKDFQPVALHVFDTGGVVVKADSPYKTIQDLVNAAKANPGKIKAGVQGVMGDGHLAALQFQRLTGVDMAIVHFDGGAPAMTALIGGHTDAQFANMGDFYNFLKTGDVRLLGVDDKVKNEFAPDVPTMESQGIKLYSSSSRGISVPAGTPKEIVDILSTAVKKAMSDPDHKKKMDEMGLSLRYMDAAQFSQYWDETEAQAKPLVDLVRAENAN